MRRYDGDGPPTDDGHGLQIDWFNRGKLAAFAVAPHTFRIRGKARGDFAESTLHRYGILRKTDLTVTVETEETEYMYIMRTEQTSLHIGRADGSITFRGAGKERLPLTVSGLTIGAEGGFDIRFTLTEGERLYGLGNAVPDRLQLRGSRATLSATPDGSSVPVPFVMSSGGWALLINTTWPHAFDLGQTNPDEMRITAEEGELDLYVFGGDDYRELLERYTDLAGKPRLLPIWAYGLTYIRDMTTHDREVLDDVLKFRQEGIPCDLIGLGSGWNDTGSREATAMRWHSTRFSAPTSGQDRSFTFVDMLQRHGFKLGLLMHCINYDLTAHTEFATRHANGSGTENTSESWYAFLRPFAGEGVASFRYSSFSQMGMETERDRKWANGMKDRELRHLYPVLLVKQTYDGYAEQTGKRPFIHCVSGYTGIQQFTALESGRYNSGVAAVVQALSMGLSGHAHTASHINVDMRESIHAGFLQPWSFINSGSYFRNPCVLEKPLRDMFRKYAKLRYRLLPYVYSTAHVAARTGMPIARAMPLMFPNDPHCGELRQQYMLGPFLLVAVYTDRVYLPEGRWINYWTGETSEGGQTISCTIPDEVGGPLFVREGAIVPLWPEVDYADQTVIKRMALHIYPGERSQFTMYEDDGVTLAHEQGFAALTEVICEANAGEVLLNIGPRSGSYAGMPDKRSYELSIFTSGRPVRIELNGMPLPENKTGDKGKSRSGWRYIRQTRCVQLEVTDVARTGARVKVSLIDPVAGLPEEAEAEAAVSGAVADEELIMGLETTDREAFGMLLSNWWNHAGDDWRLRLLHGCSLFISHMKRRGWTASEVWGKDLESVYTMHRIRSPAQGLALLCRLAWRMMDFARPPAGADIHPVIRQVLAIVDAELKRKLSLQQVALRTNVHPFYLSRLFKRHVGQPFSSYVLMQRMNRARSYLESGMKVYEAAAESGFQDTSHFSRVFAKYWGSPPETFKRRI
ncbi:TIM-barrel domain-containing protein [Paenibacillus ginsengarvi]|uniref:Helix-turn-helix domain-containing protein n=1 Tax=Paenibacillus ginsengarvi TaxID=400777 RepID=A0A3B0CKX3_9BACL|nr:TIM-barrel domain-containing protein [Paenibacillus ginsengarvi]RKN86335.1 helix-turn-helix domain-containing protein [Paenibacillus ginsengarvi]